MVTIVRNQGFILVQTQFWTVRHDLSRGGLADEIRVLHGTGGNLVAGPSGAVVDSWRESMENQPRVRIGREEGRSVVEFRGILRDAGGSKGPVHFLHRYLYSEYSVRNELTLWGDQGIRARKLTACGFSLCGCLDEYVWGTTDYARFKPRGYNTLGPHCEDLPGQVQRGVLQKDDRRPWQVAVFKRGVEGIGWTGDSRQYAWDDGAFKGKGSFSISSAGGSTQVALSPLDQSQPAACGKKLRFNWYLTISNRTATCRRKYREIAICSTPFPPEDLMRSWAKSGVDLIRIHEGEDYENRSNFFWHDGAFPPYCPPKMKLLAKYIKLCHKLGMKIIPYFSGYELSPETPAFREHGLEWYTPGFPDGHVRFTPTGRLNAVYGALMCPDSPWGDWLQGYIKKCVDTYGFDGYYLDWGGPVPCHNYNHLPGEHNGVDGLVNLLEDTRRWLGDRLLVIHAPGNGCWPLHHNVADQTVTLEEARRNIGQGGLEQYPFSIEFMGVGSAGIVPNTFEDEKLPGGWNFKRGIANMVHFNAIPYIYTYSNLSGWKNYSYPDWKSFMADEDSLFGLYRKFKDIDFTKYRFVGPRSGWVGVEGSRRDVLCSAYVGKDTLAVVSNQTAKSVPGGTALIYPSQGGQALRLPFGRLKPYEVKILRGG